MMVVPIVYGGNAVQRTQPLPVELRPVADGDVEHVLRPTSRGLFLELNELDDVIDRGPAPIEAPKHPQRLRHRQLVGELRLLQRNPEPLAQLPVIPLPPPPEDLDVAAMGRSQPLAD